jgi:hypothetical protein
MRDGCPIMFLQLLHWTGRVSALLIGGAYAYLMVGEMATPHSGSPSTFLEWTGIVLLTVAAFALPFGWRWELTSGLVSLCALALQALLIRGSNTYHVVLLLMAMPGALYCLDWLFRHPRAEAATR